MRVIVLLLYAALCRAQGVHAELFGRITDAGGVAIPQARISVVHEATGIPSTARSGARGDYHLLGLATGLYTIDVENPGFGNFRQQHFQLSTGSQVELNVQLSFGDATRVDVVATLAQTASGAVSYSVDRARIATLPLDGRNFIPLVALSPGVTLPGGGSLLPRINGSRPRTNEYLYDGISVLQPEPGHVAFYPILDGIEEFRLNLNAYAPEYGRSNGGTVIVSGKSGGNQFHGSAWEFWRNEALNARNYFALPGPVPLFRRNQYGFTLGGPIVKNRTFFFADWQGSRLHTGVTRFSTVPTDAQRSGVFGNTVLAPSQFDPIAQGVMELYPHANVAGAANNYVRTGTESDRQDQFDWRLDHTFAAAHRIFARYSQFRDTADPVTPLPDGSGAITAGVTGHAVTRADSFASEYTWTIAPNLLNQARWGYTRRGLQQTAQNTPTYLVAGFQQIGPTSGAHANLTTSVTQFQDTFSLVRGRHVWKFGLDVRRETLDALNPSNPNGAFTFNASGTGNSVASLLLGQVNAFSIDVQPRPLRPRARIAEFFAGEEWRVNNRLQLNFGTRYTLNFPSTEVDGQGAVFNLQSQQLDFPRTARRLERGNFGPRAGVALRIRDSWFLRAGYGLVWFEQTGITSPFTLPQFPFVQTVGQLSQDGIQPAFQLADGPSVQPLAIGPNAGLGQGVFSANRQQGSGYSQQWNFTMQKTVGENISFDLGYLGSKNTRLGVPDANLNQLPSQYLALASALLVKVPNPYPGQIPSSSSLGGATLTAQQLLRPYPRFTSVALFRNNTGNSIYHALQAKFEKRLSRGLTFSFAYTFSKLIDDASSVFSNTILTGPIANTGVADAYNLRGERSLSSGDIPHVFAAAWTYQIPRLWKIAGWRVAGIVRLQSGDRIAVSQATNFNASLGYGTQRPNLLRNPNDFAARNPAQWFDTTAFAGVPQFALGNSTRNPVRGPGLQNADLMLGKTFQLGEKIAAEFRGQAFNLSNTPPLGDPKGSWGSGAFGSITSAGNPRVFELAFKLLF